jgi:streptogramin lyase
MQVTSDAQNDGGIKDSLFTLREKIQMYKQPQRTTWGTGMNPTNYVYMFEEEEKEIYRIDNRDPYKEEIKIPPPYPYKRKNINYF